MNEQDVLLRERIKQFNRFVMEQNIAEMPLGLFTGRTGLCIYFYHLAQLTENKRYEKFAKRLLLSIYKDIPEKFEIGLELGLTGICWGILHLIEHKYVEGNPNYVLKDVENAIFKTHYSTLSQSKIKFDLDRMKNIAKCAFYFCNRLENSKLDSNERYLFQRIVVSSINTIENTKDIDKTIEPTFFAPFDFFTTYYFRLICQVYKLGFYNYKIEKVCDEWTDHLLSSLPLLHSHRFLLANTLKNVNFYLKSSKWDEHIRLLRKHIDISYIINTEFRNKNVLYHNGLSGFYHFLKASGEMTEENELKIFQKLKTTEYWNDFEKAEDREKQNMLGLMHGLGGVILICMENKNNVKLLKNR